MAELPSPEIVARYILDHFADQRLRAGEVCPPNHVTTIQLRHRLRQDDMNAGFAYAVEKGWINITPNKGFQLTEAGFAQM